MPTLLNIDAGEEKTADGLRVAVRSDSESVWMHGKWLDLAEDHAVVFARKTVRFIRPDKRTLFPGEFPAWVAKGKGKKPAIAMMFNITQFRGGRIEVDGRSIAV